MDENDYPTEVVPMEFFGGKTVSAGDKETVEIVSVADGRAQIRCFKKGGNRVDRSQEAGSKYKSKMTEMAGTPEGY